jgi:hypothetical protein
MSTMLENRGFTITKCFGEKATRDGIRAYWLSLIQSLDPEDTVVLYYSGHGSVVKAPEEAPDKVNSPRPRYHQLLVPMDYHESPTEDFRGILEVELIDLLRQTTDITTNVTAIFDCCHAANIARDPINARNPRYKCIPRQKLSLLGYIERLKQEGYLQGDVDAEENPHAVRIYASDVHSSAYEYQNNDGIQYSIMTEFLVSEINKLENRYSSWKATMAKVREQVAKMFPSQRPHVCGPHHRLYFSMEERRSTGYHLVTRGDNVILQAGRLAGVNIGDEYAIWPSGRGDHGTSLLGEGTVSSMCGSEAALRVKWQGDAILPPGGAWAYLQTAAPVPTWPIQLPEGLKTLDAAILESTILRRWRPEESQDPLLTMELRDKEVVLYNTEGVQVGCMNISSNHFRDLVQAAEQIACSQHLLNLQCNDDRERFVHDLRISLRPLDEDGVRIPEEGEIYFRLANHGPERLFVHAFYVNVAGIITLIEQRSFGTRESATLGENWLRVDRGIQLMWPVGVPRTCPITEHMVLLITDRDIDLSALETGSAPLRNAKKPVELSRVRYDIVHESFKVMPRAKNSDAPSS